MDQDRFDRVSRVVASGVTRRATLGMLAALGLVGLIPRPAEAARKRRCKSDCTVCQRCVNNRCRKKANGAACPDGTCRNGQCTPISVPNCLPESSSVDETCASCCSGYCRPFNGGDIGPYVCAQSRDGGMCLTNSDCHSFECINFRCVGPFQHPGEPCTDNTDCIGGFCRDPGLTCTPSDPAEICEIDTDCRLGECGIKFSEPRNGVVCLRRDVYEPCAVDEDCETMTCSQNQCVCPQGWPDYCVARGRAGCVVPSCNDRCGAVCNPQNANPCGGCEQLLSLVCDFDASQDGYYCLPPDPVRS